MKLQKSKNVSANKGKIIDEVQCLIMEWKIMHVELCV